MKALAYALVTLGFLAGAFQAVRTPTGIEVAPYLLGLAVGVAGVALARWQSHRSSREAGHVAANLAELDERLERLATRAEAFDRDKAGIPVDDLRRRVEREFADDLDGFAERRETIGVRFGLQAYADVMDPFAAAERHLNRVWSASTDGYGDEAREHVARAREELVQARDRLRALSASGR